MRYLSRQVRYNVLTNHHKGRLTTTTMINQQAQRVDGGQSVFDRLTRFVKNIFKTNLEIFFEALKMSPNAQGYVGGSITELLLKQKLEKEYHLEVKRIREKWEGRKHANHHGDFYFRKPETSLWYVLESKGVKSNSEKWHKLYNYANLKGFMITHSDKISWMDFDKPVEIQVTDWIKINLPKFDEEYKEPLYEYEEVVSYKSGKRITEKSKAIDELRALTRDEINDMVKARLVYVMSKVKVLETHFVSGTSGASQRTQATPRKDEFNLISVDIALRHDEHKFLFANPQQLDSSGSDPNHLQQNYIMGFIFPAEKSAELSLTEEWYEKFFDVFDTLDERNSIRESDMQIDNRNAVVIGIDEAPEIDE